MNVPSPGVAVHYNVMYAGVVPNVNFTNLDPSGRSDLLKSLDIAKDNGQIVVLRRRDDYRDNCRLSITGYALTITQMGTDQLELCVPMHQIASVGYVREEFTHIVNVKIGELYSNPSLFDLAILYCKNRECAEMICDTLGQRFQQVYRETVLAVPQGLQGAKCRSARTASSPARSRLAYATGFATCGTPSPSRAPSSASEAQSNDLANNYIQMLSSALTSDELREFAELLGRWQDGDIPVRELALKLMELYGPDRKHLLEKLRHLMGEEDGEELSDFLNINGIATSSTGGSSAYSQRLASAASSSQPRRST